jgi:cytochrome c2
MPADWAALAGAAWERLFESRPCLPIGDVQKDFGGQLAGGRMIEGDPGTLLLTVGDFGREAYPQDPDADYGKLLAIGTTCCERRLVSLGHRNAQGLTIDADGAIWVTDQGPRGGDELNLIVPGQDYGWPSVTYGVQYDIKAFHGQPVAGHHDGYAKPVYAWVPSVAAGNIFQVRGFSKEWEGDFLVATLKAQELRRLRVEDGRVIYDEPIPLGVRLRDSGQLADGRIVVLSDDSRLFILSPTAFPDGSTYVSAEIAKLSDESRAHIAGCRECHSIAVGMAASADRINLADVFGRDIASSPLFQYSPALVAREGVWDARSLGEFLRDPQAFAPGTTMAIGGIGDASVRNELVGFLEGLRQGAERP